MSGPEIIRPMSEDDAENAMQVIDALRADDTAAAEAAANAMSAKGLDAFAALMEAVAKKRGIEL